ncbi:MAG: alpha-L-fucosidase, partial [Tepidisphaeraceae bacterium]
MLPRLSLCLLLLGLPAPARAADPVVPAPLTETPGQYEARIKWWREAKFGLFIHWGPSSVNGTEISWSRKGHPFDHPGMETVPPEVYDNLYRKFNPTKFDADAWMQMAKGAGMKYVVLIAKHHDGFSMWPTKLRPDYSMSATPFKRDIVGEIADAAHKHGLKLGLYYSTRDWTHPDYLKDGNAKYNDFYHGQIRELLTNYGRVDMLWFDHVAGNWGDYRFRELYDIIYGLQPGIMVNDRAARFIRGTADKPTPEIARLVRGDFDTPEQRIGVFQPDRAWESCVTMTECKDGGGWSYRPDGRTRGFEECIRMLVSCAVGDGNLLFNVGPLPTGEIEPQQVKTLGQVGRWMAKYGQSIYSTRGGPLPSGRWGGLTCRGDTIWVHVFDWPGETLRLSPIKQKVTSWKVLTGGEVKVVQTDRGLDIALPRDQQDKVDTVIELQLDAPVTEIIRNAAIRSMFEDPACGTLVSAAATFKASSTSVHDRPATHARLFSGDRVPEGYAFHTADELNPWIIIDLGKTVSVCGVRIENRPAERRTDGLILSISEDGQTWTQTWKAPQWEQTWEVPVTQLQAGAPVPGRPARYLKLE